MYRPDTLETPSAGAVAAGATHVQHQFCLLEQHTVASRSESPAFDKLRSVRHRARSIGINRTNFPACARHTRNWH